MSNEDKIINMLEVLTIGQAETSQRLDKMDQRFDKMDQRLDKLEHEQTRINLIIENEVTRDIRLLVEGHGALCKRLDNLQDLNERVIDLKMDTDALKFATREVLKVAK